MNRDKILAIKAEFARKQAVPDIFANVINALILVCAFWSTISHDVLSYWFSILLIGAIIRIFISSSFGKNLLNINSNKVWYYIYASLTCVFAIIWGTAGVLFFVSDQTDYQLFLSILLCGMVAGSVSSLPVFLPVFYFFALCLMGPITITLLSSGEGLVFYMGLLCIMFILYISMAGWKSHSMIIDALASRFQHEAMARTDELTQVMNRRAFNDVFNNEIARAKRNQRIVAFILCDIDHFKQINDQYGHLAGDAILRDVAQGIEKSINRPSDTVARFGGEEFAILLAETDKDGALYIAEKIRAHIEEISNIWQAQVTISLGVYTCTPSQETKPDDIIHCADKALYVAKKEGRNQVQYFDC